MKVLTFGEMMLRLSTQNNLKIEQAKSFAANYGGGEANVAIGLSALGSESKFFSKLPENPLGKTVVRTLRENNVDTSSITYGGERLGIYFLEPGYSVRGSKVIYDRKDAAITTLNIDELRCDEIFTDVDWFHISGITPALSDSLLEVTKHLLIECEKRGIYVSFDLNYRKKLWSLERAQVVLKELMPYVNLCIGFSPIYTEYPKGKLALSEYEEILKRLHNEYNLQYSVVTLRDVISSSTNKISACIYDGKDFYKGQDYHIDIIDRVGAGDAFTTGLIHGLRNYDTKKALEFAIATSALKHTLHGDFNLFDEVEVLGLMESGSKEIER